MNKKIGKIYLDNAATTKLDPKVIEAMNKSFNTFGNPSSLHTFGQEARKLVLEARDNIASFLDCKPTEVIFTSGGSESDNLAIKGVISACHSREGGNLNLPHRSPGTTSRYIAGPEDDKKKLPHVITSAIEHHAVLHTVQDLEKEGKIEATYIKPNEKGIIQVKDIKAAIKENTVLVSVMYVNNEVGTVQPIREIGKMIESKNALRMKNHIVISNDSEKSHAQKDLSSSSNPPTGGFGMGRDDNWGRIYFHTDAVQAAEFFEMGTKYLHVDLLTMTAHKIHGPKGVGVLFVKKGTPIDPMIVGGEHEFKLRAGTENTSGITGLAEAIKLVSRNSHSEPEFSGEESSEHIRQAQCELHERAASPRSFANAQDDKRVTRDDNYIKVMRLRDKLEEEILKNIPETYLNGDKEKRSPVISNISFKNAEGEAIILNLDFLGIAVSSGSACTARSLEPSHVLTAMGVPHALSHGAIRFSLSRETTEEEIDRVIEVLPQIIEKLREMSPFG